MDDEVRAVLDWILQCRRQESIIDGQQGATLLGDRRNPLYIDDAQQRI